MRDLPRIVALSLLVHAAVIGWYVTRPSTPVRAATRNASTVESVTRVEEPPVEVVFLGDETEQAFSDQTPAVRVTPRVRARPTTDHAIVSTTTTEIQPTTVEPAQSVPETNRPSMLSMRDGRPERTIPRPGTDGISDETLKQMVDGTIPVKITNLPGAQADADYVTAQARLHNAKWVEAAKPAELTAARFALAAARQAKKEVELVEQKDGTYTSNKTTYKASVNRDGTVALKDKGNWQQKSLFSAEFDVTDALMRRHGQDPYASEKLKFLDRTRDPRVEIGKRYRTAHLAMSAQLMAGNLARLWATTSDPATRKDELFALWDECAETGDEEIVAGAADARRLLIHWIETKHVTFTPTELASFNARKQSKATFAP